MRILDLGAGRGAWTEDKAAARRETRMLKGKVAEVVGCDIDPAVLDNPSVDRAVVSKPEEPLPFPDEHFDLIVADYVLEHVDDPASFVAEVKRVLKPGGWFCARTPNRWGYISILTRLIRNASHKRILRWAQPDRQEVDVFPTRFRMNSLGAVERHFASPEFTHCSYHYQAEPAYHFNSRVVFALMRVIDGLLPPVLHANLFVFVRRNPVHSTRIAND
jgi:SAM-dependent methyltransferase